jgi:hypothetical protein
MSKNITPADSVCPIFLVANDPIQLAKDKADDEAQAEAEVTKATAREALLDRLGITADEAKLLLGA